MTTHNEPAFVSVIIPCRNETRFLARCLDSVLGGDYPSERMEVLVIDGRSTDGTRDLIAQYAAHDPRVRMIDNPDGITPCALNRGIEAASGDVIARVDAHAEIAPDYLSNAIAYLETTGASNVGGSMRTLPQDHGLWSGAIIAALSHRFGVGNSYFRIGSAEPRWVDTVFGGCWPREVFEKVGLFNTGLRRSQDMEFSLRLKAAGLRTLLAPNVRSDYYARTRLKDFIRHNFVNGQWAVLPFLYSDVIPVSLRHLIPLVFALGLLAGAAVLPWTPLLLAAVVVPYALVAFAASAQVASNDRAPLRLLQMPLIFFSLHFSYGLGSIAGALEAAVIRFGQLRWKEKSCLPQP
ncbi:MAG: glycosyltransferase family 2 protein [Bryobacteraceae bacterium]